ncbi:MAG: hypothetical protein B6D46_04385 [Polyangiaceae bacterium UTPRO1]|nr:EthD domain-containing protein [Myxococcales bacterium]OQY68105.1 MAG: hypothetical protein B6D46_04385 [Polyangiaceae bacterium UTPRO1]
MITLNHLVRRQGSVEPARFRDYWLTEHAARSAALMQELGVEALIKCETLYDDDAADLLRQVYGTASDGYDFVDQMQIYDFARFKSLLARPEVCASWQELHAGEARYVDHQRSDYWFSVEHRQVLLADHCVATRDNAFLKGFYVARMRDGLSLAEAQLHWNACHGPLARRFLHILPFVKYVQGHRIESRVGTEIKTMLGGGFADSSRILGQAEVWLDRRALMGLQIPEAQRMMRLLVEDIALFIEAQASHSFGAKEHVIFERPPDLEPIPRLFSAD